MEEKRIMSTFVCLDVIMNQIGLIIDKFREKLVKVKKNLTDTFIFFIL